jgi:hypothetical protein
VVEVDESLLKILKCLVHYEKSMITAEDMFGACCMKQRKNVLEAIHDQPTNKKHSAI